MSQNLSSAAVVIGSLRVKWLLKKDKTRVLKTNGGLIKVESIAQCSLGADLGSITLKK